MEPGKVNINLTKLRTEVANREERKYQTFNKILDICYNKIITTNKTSDDYTCIFEVPRMIFGLPLYNLEDAVRYIMLSLVDKGFEVHLAIPNKIYISWRPESETRTQYCKQLYNLDKPQLTLQYYPGNTNGGNGGAIGGGNHGGEMKLFSSKPKQIQKNYKPIEDYRQTTTSMYEKDDIELFQSKLDELFT